MFFITDVNYLKLLDLLGFTFQDSFPMILEVLVFCFCSHINIFNLFIDGTTFLLRSLRTKKYLSFHLAYAILS